MIENSFVLLDKVGLRTERRIWEQGVHTWDEFMSAHIQGISPARKAVHNLHLEKARKQLQAGNMGFLAQCFPPSEQWRFWDALKQDAVFLDIETSQWYGDITVIGMFDGKETKTMVKGRNLNKSLFEKEMKQYKLVVTFNGSSFDLPIISRYFQTTFNLPHIDLKNVCWRLGLFGGLKKIEKHLSIGRAPEVEDMSGEGAIELWYRYQQTGDARYLEKLVLYNEEDCANLKQLGDRIIPRLWQRVRGS